MEPVYPHTQSGMALAGQVMRNELIAHCNVYKAAKAMNPNLQIGITHQWLKFEPLNGNPIETLVCYYLSKIVHYSVFNFFKTGTFSLEVPLMANVQFTLPDFDAQKPPIDWLGVQCYGYPQLGIFQNWGVSYPGEQTVNLKVPFLPLGFTFGATCAEGGKVQHFGPSYYPKSIGKCLEESAQIPVPKKITETGCDSNVQLFGENQFAVNEQVQKEYFQELMPILRNFQVKHGDDQLTDLFVWTHFRGQLEWNQGSSTLGTMRKENNDYYPTDSSLYLDEVYARL